MSMHCLSNVFGRALIVGLATGKAHFRGVYGRDEDPQKYWTIIGCYAVMVLAGLLSGF